jgi:hypothetical protein
MMMVGEGAAAHEGEWCDLDRPGGNAALHPLGRKHVIQGVVERPQIRIDLLAHVAGKEAEALACLNRRARQDQPVASAAFETDGRERHREISLAGAGGTGGEDEVITLQRCEIGALRGRARRDKALPRADLLRLGKLTARFKDFARLERARMANGADDLADPDHLALSEPDVKLLQHRLCRGARGFRPTQADRIAVDHGLDAETVLEHGEIGVIIAKKIAHEPEVVEEHDGRFAATIDLRGGGALQRRSPLACQG